MIIQAVQRREGNDVRSAKLRLVQFIQSMTASELGKDCLKPWGFDANESLSCRDVERTGKSSSQGDLALQNSGNRLADIWVRGRTKCRAFDETSDVFFIHRGAEIAVATRPDYREICRVGLIQEHPRRHVIASLWMTAALCAESHLP